MAAWVRTAPAVREFSSTSITPPSRSASGPPATTTVPSADRASAKSARMREPTVGSSPSPLPEPVTSTIAAVGRIVPSSYSMKPASRSDPSSRRRSATFARSVAPSPTNSTGDSAWPA